MRRKRKRNRNYVECSAELMALMKRKRNNVEVEPSPDFDLYLPDELWESIFKLVKKKEDLKSLSAVSKQCLSITSRLRLSLTLRISDIPSRYTLFQRFPNITSLNLQGFDEDIDILLPQISRFPLNITSLYLAKQLKFPARGLRGFSRNIKSLTSLTCSHTLYFDHNYQFFLIAHCFPMLQILNLSNITCITLCSNLRATRKLEALELNLSFGFPKSDVLNLYFQCPNLEVLKLSFTNVDDQQLYIISKACPALLELRLRGCPRVTETGVKHVLENCTQLTEIDIGLCFMNPTVVASMLFSTPSLKRITPPPRCSFSDTEKIVFKLRGCILHQLL